MAELRSKTLTFSRSVRLLASICAICTKAFERPPEPLSTDQAYHNSFFANAAPVMRGSTRSSQRCPSGVCDWYPCPPIHFATPMSVEVGAASVSLQENTRSVLVSTCAAKNAVVPQFCATRKLFRSWERNFSAVGDTEPIDRKSTRLTPV